MGLNLQPVSSTAQPSIVSQINLRGGKMCHLCSYRQLMRTWQTGVTQNILRCFQSELQIEGVWYVSVCGRKSSTSELVSCTWGLGLQQGGLTARSAVLCQLKKTLP
eukprot:1151045-Pelagomonas_calceolata.AAC.11